MKSKLFAFGAALLLMLAGCGGGGGPKKVKVESVTLDRTTATMDVGQTIQLHETVMPEDATDKSVTWTASGEGIVSVVEGLVTALKAGQSTVTVTTVDGGFTATCAITVTIPVTGVSLDKASESLKAGETLQLTATVQPDNASNKNVVWTTSDEAVASVSESGLVTALAAGTSTIKVITSDGLFEASCVVTVWEEDYPEGTYCGTAVVNGGNIQVVLAIGNKTNKLVGVRLSNLDAEATSISYNPQSKELEIETSGNYSGLAYGKITGTYDKAASKIKNVSFNGAIAEYASNNGEFDCVYIQDQLTCDGTTEELQSQFKRRYNDGSWHVDSSNTDRIKHEENCVSGTGAMSIRPCGTSFSAYGLSLQNDFSETSSATNIGFWVYNPGESEIQFRTFLYKSTGLSGHFEIGALKAPAGQWTYVSMGFGSQTGYGPFYNFNLSVWKNQNANGMTTRLIFDNIVMF